MKKVVGYIRVSTVEQVEEGFSIEGQKHHILAYCNQNNLQLVKCYIDEGISGKGIEERIGIKKLLEDAPKRKFEEIITWKVSRVARNVKDLLRILEVLHQNSITFRAISEGIATDSLNGLFCLQMLGAVAELERNIIVENVKLGVSQCWQEGWYSGGEIYGYNLIPKKICQEQSIPSNLQVNEEEARIVREIYKRYEIGQGYKAIVNYLNGQGVLSKKGKQFSVAVIKKILENSIYAGILHYTMNGKKQLIKGEHIPLISLEQWEDVQQLKSMKVTHKKKSNHEFTLKRLLKCPNCGSTMVAKTMVREKRKHNYYSCSNYENRGNQACNTNLVVAEEIEKEVYHYLKQYLEKTWIIEDVHKKVFQNSVGFQETMKELNRLKNIQDTLQKRRKLLMIQFETDQITQESFVARLQTTKKEESKVEEQIDCCNLELEKYKIPTIQKEAIKRAFEQMEEVFQNGNQRLTEAVLQASIQKIIIGKDKHIQNIVFNKGYEESFAMRQEEQQWEAN